MRVIVVAIALCSCYPTYRSHRRATLASSDEAAISAIIVNDTTNHLMRHVVVEVIDSAGRVVARRSSSILGRATFGQLAPAIYVLRASGRDVVPSCAQVTLFAGDARSVTIRMPSSSDRPYVDCASIPRVTVP